MTYSIRIYAFNDLLVFTGAMDMYFEKYKGIGPGYYDRPMAVLPHDCSAEDVAATIQKCIIELQNHQESIFCDNSQNDIMQMEKRIFQNFKLFGITTSKSQIIKQSAEILIRRKEGGYVLTKSKAKGRHMMVEKEISFPVDTPMLEIAQGTMELLNN